MAKYQHFEDLPVWQDAANLYGLVADLLEINKLPLSYAFKNQLERATLSVSNNIAEGFERMTTKELISFLAFARGSAGEVRSMLLVAQSRSGMQKYKYKLEALHTLAKSCSRQITAWIGSIEESSIKGKRHLTGDQKRLRNANDSLGNFRQKFLNEIGPEHALYNSPEAIEARKQSCKSE